jgi:hypothetical protein
MAMRIHSLDNFMQRSDIEKRVNLEAPGNAIQDVQNRKSQRGGTYRTGLRGRKD